MRAAKVRGRTRGRVQRVAHHNHAQYSIHASLLLSLYPVVRVRAIHHSFCPGSGEGSSGEEAQASPG